MIENAKDAQMIEVLWKFKIITKMIKVNYFN
jgi:hypothetical protein